jgi:hypothetical protein
VFNVFFLHISSISLANPSSDVGFIDSMVNLHIFCIEIWVSLIQWLICTSLDGQEMCKRMKANIF